MQAGKGNNHQGINPDRELSEKEINPDRELSGALLREVTGMTDREWSRRRTEIPIFRKAFFKIGKKWKTTLRRLWKAYDELAEKNFNDEIEHFSI